jgi:hypothetical protein
LSDGSEDARTGHQRGGEIENRCAGGMMDRRQPNRGKAFYHAVHRRARAPRHPRRPSIIPPPSFSDPTHPVRPRADSEALVATQTQHASIPKATGKSQGGRRKKSPLFFHPVLHLCLLSHRPSPPPSDSVVLECLAVLPFGVSRRAWLSERVPVLRAIATRKTYDLPAMMITCPI